MVVKLDKEVLSATQAAIDAMGTQLPGLVSRADGLGVGWAMSGLRGQDGWCTTTSTDLSARIGLIDRMEKHQTDFGGVKVTEAMLEQMAGAGMAVSDQMVAITQAELAKQKGGAESIWSWDNEENFSRWLEGVQAKALSHLPGMAGRDAMIEAGVHALNEFRQIVANGSMATAAFTQLVTKGGLRLISRLAHKGLTEPLAQKWIAAGHVQWANWLGGAIRVADDNYLNGKMAWSQPGAWKLNLLSRQMLSITPHLADFDKWLATAKKATKVYSDEPTRFARILSEGLGSRLAGDVSSLLASGTRGQRIGSALTTAGNFVFGKPWTTMIDRSEVTVGRNSTNLITVARADGLMEATRTAGALRGLGVAGGVLATADSAMALFNNRDQIDDNWNSGTSGKAKVIGDVAEVAFNASLTAATVAPNPYTLVAVGVTGMVYGGARLVEHWDDVTKAAGEAVDWVGDKVADLGGAIDDGIDAVKESPLNPGNWF